MTVSQLIELLRGFDGDLSVGYWKKGFRLIEEVYEEEDSDTGNAYVVLS